MPLVKSILANAGCTLLAITAYGASASATLSGTVVDSTGAPIAGALVNYSTVPAMVRTVNGLAPSGPIVASYALTDTNGDFSVTGLPAGRYNLCAYGTKSTHLGSCEWGRGITGASLVSGQTATVHFQIADGTLLTFQVQDPRNQIRDLESLPAVNGRMPLTGANFAIGVWAGTRYARARLVSTSGATRQYQLAIPKTLSVRLHLDTLLNVVDANTVAVPLGKQSLTISAGGLAAISTNLTVP